MGTDAPDMLSPVAVVTENLVAILRKPFFSHNPVEAPRPLAVFSSMLTAISVDVINGQELQLMLTTASTDASQCLKDCLLQLQPGPSLDKKPGLWVSDTSFPDPRVDMIPVGLLPQGHSNPGLSFQLFLMGFVVGSVVRSIFFQVLVPHADLVS